MKRLLMLASLALILAAVPAAAQMSIDIVPVVGFYLPTADLASESMYDPDLDITIDATLKQKTAFAFGGKVDFWTLGGVGFEASAVYAMSDVKMTGSAEGVSAEISMDANVMLAGAKVLYRLPGAPEAPARFHLAGGLALITRGGDTFENVDGTTDIGGVIGVGTTIAMPGSPIAIRIDAEDYIYSAKFGSEGEESDSKLQNDILITAGVAIGLGK